MTGVGGWKFQVRTGNPPSGTGPYLSVAAFAQQPGSHQVPQRWFGPWYVPLFVCREGVLANLHHVSKKVCGAYVAVVRFFGCYLFRLVVSVFQVMPSYLCPDLDKASPLDSKAVWEKAVREPIDRRLPGAMERLTVALKRGGCSKHTTPRDGHTACLWATLEDPWYISLAHLDGMGCLRYSIRFTW